MQQKKMVICEGEGSMYRIARELKRKKKSIAGTWQEKIVIKC